MDQLEHKLPPRKKSKLSKKRQEESDKINRRLTEENQEWRD